MAKMSLSSRSNRSDQSGTSPATWTSCALMRNLLPDRNTDPSTTRLTSKLLADVAQVARLVLEGERRMRATSPAALE